MLTLRDLETYLMVKDYMEKNDIEIEELLDSINDEKVPLTIKCDGEMKKFTLYHSQLCTWEFHYQQSTMLIPGRVIR